MLSMFTGMSKPWSAKTLASFPGHSQILSHSRGEILSCSHGVAWEWGYQNPSLPPVMVVQGSVCICLRQENDHSASPLLIGRTTFEIFLKFILKNSISWISKLKIFSHTKHTGIQPPLLPTPLDQPLLTRLPALNVLVRVVRVLIILARQPQLKYVSFHLWCMGTDSSKIFTQLDPSKLQCYSSPSI